MQVDRKNYFLGKDVQFWNGYEKGKLDPSVEKYLILEKLGVDLTEYAGEPVEDIFEQVSLEKIMTLIPESLYNEIEGSWITVMSYDEQSVSADGRIMVEISDVDSIVLTKEAVGDPDEYAWIAWVKI